MQETFKGKLKSIGNSAWVLIPSSIIKKYQCEEHQEVEVIIIFEKVKTKSCDI